MEISLRSDVEIAALVRDEGKDRDGAARDFFPGCKVGGGGSFRGRNFAPPINRLHSRVCRGLAGSYIHHDSPSFTEIMPRDGAAGKNVS